MGHIYNPIKLKRNKGIRIALKEYVIVLAGDTSSQIRAI